MADPAELIAARLRNAVEFAAGIFESYAQMHEAKGTPEGERKAHVNAGYAKEMRAALTPPAPTQGASADAVVLADALLKEGIKPGPDLDLLIEFERCAKRRDGRCFSDYYKSIVAVLARMGTVPVGWKLVPVHMTDEMRTAAARAWRRTKSQDAQWAQTIAAAPETAR